MIMAERDNCSIHVDYSQCKEECTKNITELANEITHFWSLSSLLGTNLDTDILREQLRHSRKRSYELAKYGRLKQFPMLRSYIGKGLRSEDYEYLGTLLTSAMDLLILYLCKTVTLLESFHPKNQVSLIRTGMNGNKQKCNLSNTGADNKPADVITREEVDSILKNIHALKCMVNDIYETVDFKPWSAAPRQSVIDIEGDSDYAITQAPRAGFISVRSMKYVKTRRCKCIAATVISTAIVLTVVIGIIIGITT